MTYNPFDKSISDLTSDDLQKLIEKQVSEGYYIEYKSALPEGKKIAKSIAAFANTYGGWLIIGVNADKENNTANEINGFTLANCHDPVSVVREAIKAFIDPAPIFFIKSLNLKNRNVVLIVYVPDDQNCPFIHKDGRVYRRIGDSSSPIPETDRFALDRLYDKGKGLRKEFELFCRKERIYSQSEKNSPYVKVFLSPYPYPEGIIDDLLEISGIENFLKISQNKFKIFLGDQIDEINISMEGNIPFNAVQSTHESIILRQRDINNFFSLGSSFELFFNGNAIISIPAKLFTKNDLSLSNKIKSIEVKNELSKYSKSDSVCFLEFFDLWINIVILLSYYQLCLKDIKLVSEIKFAIKLQNFVQVIPFIDSDKWVYHVQKYSLPVLNNRSTYIPSDLSTPRILRISKESIDWLTLYTIIGLALGLPWEAQAELIGRKIAETISNQKK
jgi:hypothetical protein